MTSLESIVLPLEQSRALVEKGIVLETPLCWYVDIDTGDGPRLATYVWMSNENDGDDETVPAPTLGELLDAIRAKYPDVNFEIYDTPHGAREIQAWLNDDADEADAEGATDFLAAAALLMEVAK